MLDVLDFFLDNKLKFDKHVFNFCSKAHRKLSALTRLDHFLPFKKRRILFKTFIELQFKYFPLILIFHGRLIELFHK